MKLVGLTRFDVRLSTGQPLPTPEWYEDRLGFFRDIFAQSVAAQSYAPDDWIVFIRDDTPPWAVSEIGRTIAGIGARMKRVPSVFGAEDVRASLPRQWWASERLVTFRCDNDDGFDRYAVESIAAAAQGDRKPPFALNILKGIQCRRGYLYRRLDPLSPFVALVEGPLPHGDPATVFATTHDQLDTLYPVTQIRTTTWWQSLHGNNLGNHSHGVAVRNSIPTGFEHLAVGASLADETTIHLLFRKTASVLRLLARIMLSRRRWLWLVKSLRGLLHPRQ